MKYNCPIPVLIVSLLVVLTAHTPNSSLALENGLARTPPMGWLAWERYVCEIDCKQYPGECIDYVLFQQMANHLVDDGYKKAGYEYVNIDDCWSTRKRDGATQELVADPLRFPESIGPLAEYMHSLGLKMGLYGDCGTQTCQGFPGQLKYSDNSSGNYFELDAQKFADWKIDSFKFDGCYLNVSNAAQLCPPMGTALNQTQRPMLFSCSWPAYENDANLPTNWDLVVEKCNLWRAFGDIEDSWKSVLDTIDWFIKKQDLIVKYHGPGHWFDADQLVIGDFGLSHEQELAHMAVWCIWASPLYMSNDLRNISKESSQILLNKHAIAVNQDKLGIFGLKVQEAHSVQVFVKPIEPLDSRDTCPSYAIVYLDRRTLGNGRFVGFNVSTLLEQVHTKLAQASDQWKAWLKCASSRTNLSFNVYDLFDDNTKIYSDLSSNSNLRLRATIMELMWQTTDGLGPIQPELARADDIRSQLHRIRRRQRRHIKRQQLRSRRSMSNDIKEQSNLINDNSELPLQHSIPRPLGSNMMISSDRLTLLTEPKTSLANLIPDTDMPPISPMTMGRGRSPPVTTANTVTYNSNSINKPSHNLTPHDNAHPASRESLLASTTSTTTTTNDGQTSFSSTTALLIMLIFYIIWQCFRGQQSNEQPKCLDDWPATLLSPSKKKKKKRRGRESGEFEMQTIEGLVEEVPKQNNTSSKSAAILRLRSDTDQPEIEVIQVDDDDNNDNAKVNVQTSAVASKVTALKKTLTKNSFVVAANRAAKPRVKLISNQMRKFVDIEAQEARDGHEINKTIKGRFVRLLHTSGLAKAFVRREANDEEGHCQEDEQQQQQQQQERVPIQDAGIDIAGSTPMQVPEMTTTPTSETIKVMVHNSQQNQADSRSESLLGFAGSFLESTINPSSSFVTVPSGAPLTSLNDNDVTLQHLPPGPNQVSQLQSLSSLALAYGPPHLSCAQLHPTSPNQSAANNKLNDHIPCHQLEHSQHNLQQQQQQQQQPQQLACDCALARSSSQSNHPSCSTQHLLTTSPTSSIRPCCSVSPSAMNRHQINGANRQHQNTICNHQSQQTSVLFGAPVPNQDQATCGPLYSGAAHHLNGRRRHAYENYYDDEQEDTYRRLTASIGMQFGLALDHHHHHHHQPALLQPDACSLTCKCSPTMMSQKAQNYVCASDQASLPIKSSGLSSGESDSGNFSSVNRQTVDSENLCNDSTCSLCQSSLLTTAPSQDSGPSFTPRRPSLAADPTSTLGSAALVPRWHHQRRSTLYARQPRRMSIAGVASNSNQLACNENYEQHFLHRASIASDGTNTFHQHQHNLHQHQHHHQHHTASAAAAALKQPHVYPTCQFFSSNKTNGYSSSAGSSSGIGFSGSQCLNTPTTGVCSHGSFTTNKPFCDLSNANLTLHNDTQPIMCQFVLIDNPQNPACLTQNARLDSAATRKFSLPAQLESHAAEHLMSNRCNLLFDSQRDEIETKATYTTHSRSTGRTSSHPIRSFSQVNESSSSVDHKGAIVSQADQKADGTSRRLSQIITRQSSFWLEDEHDIDLESKVVPSNSDEVLDGLQAVDPSSTRSNTDPAAHETAKSSAQISSSPNPSSANTSQSPEIPECTRLPSASSSGKQRRLSSSSSTSSPSPDFMLRHKQRLLSRASQSTAIKKKRLLGNSKQRRSQRIGSQTLNRRHESQSSSSIAREALLALKRHDTNSTDDEREKSKQEDGLSSFDREVAAAEIVRGTTNDINSTSLERQCRDLWKLRATLHDDGSVCDNWSNYHQRLNRRYDSGYKSIENQFSSSLEGNVPNMMNLSLRQASPLSDHGIAGRDSDRPQSGCSGLIPEQIEETTQIDLSPTLNEEETQSLLENCDDHQDEQ